MLAAIKNNNFEGDSTARTWLTGILKHKIIDLQRKQIREQPLSDLIDPDASDTSMDDFFDNSGHWLDKLPNKLATIFMMRGVAETDSEHICKVLGITATNAWVMLY